MNTSTITRKLSQEALPSVDHGEKRHRTRPHSQSSTLVSIQNSILAGYAAGICGTLVGFPLDSLKVFAQTGTKAISSNDAHRTTTSGNFTTSPIHSVTLNLRHHFSSPKTTRQHVAFMTTIIPKSSLSVLSVGFEPFRQVRRLYSGVGVPLFTVGIVQSINFAVYDSTRRYLHQGMPGSYLTDDSLSNVAVSAAVAGAVLASLTSPMLVLKTQQQVQNVSFREALRSSTSQNSRMDPIRRLYRGFSLHLAFECVARAFYFGTYEYLKRHVWSSGTTQDRILAAGTSGTLCWAVFFPLDSVRNRVYAEATAIKSIPWKGWVSVAQELYQRQGIRGFYRGFTFSVVRAGPVASAILPIYDTTLQYLNETRT